MVQSPVKNLPVGTHRKPLGLLDLGSDCRILMFIRTLEEALDRKGASSLSPEAYSHLKDDMNHQIGAIYHVTL